MRIARCAHTRTCRDFLATFSGTAHSFGDNVNGNAQINDVGLGLGLGPNPTLTIH